jgi:hypothetical protein
MFCEIDVEEVWSGSMFDAALERKASVSVGESSSSSNIERRGRAREESNTFDITRQEMARLEIENDGMTTAQIDRPFHTKTNKKARRNTNHKPGSS